VSGLVHELSVAMGIVDVVIEELERRGGGRVRSVHLRLGALSGVAREALLSAFPLACEGSSLEGAALVVADEPVSAWCPACDAERPVASVMDRRCVQCGTLAPEVVKGTEIEVTALELDE